MVLLGSILAWYGPGPVPGKLPAAGRRRRDEGGYDDDRWMESGPERHWPIQKMLSAQRAVYHLLFLGVVYLVD